MNFREITVDVPQDHPGRQAEVVWYGTTVDDMYAYGIRLLDDVADARTLLAEEAVLWLQDGITSVVGTVVAAGNDYDDDLVGTAACWLVVQEELVRGDDFREPRAEDDSG